MKLDTLECCNCGAPLNMKSARSGWLKCEYCGTVHRTGTGPTVYFDGAGRVREFQACGAGGSGGTGGEGSIKFYYEPAL